MKEAYTQALMAAVIEWRDARKDILSAEHPSCLPKEAWTRLADAEHDLMKLADLTLGQMLDGALP
jgi:hypothetical protein